MQFFILPQEGEKSSFFMFFLLVLLLVSCIDTKVDSTPSWASPISAYSHTDHISYFVLGFYQLCLI